MIKFSNWFFAVRHRLILAVTYSQSKKSPNIICHFFRDSAERCRIVDMHLAILAKKHIEAKFCKVNAEKSPFLTQRLRIKVIPTIVCVKDSKTKDYIVGFTDLGNRDDYSTEMMEWRLAKSLAIKYDVNMGSISTVAFSGTQDLIRIPISGWLADAAGRAEEAKVTAAATEKDNS